MKTGFIALVFVFLGSYLLGLLLKVENKQDFLIYKSTCNLLHGNCYISDADVEYNILFKGDPSPLTPFSIQLTSLKLVPSNIKVEFEMEGMNMGSNIYSLNNIGGSWSADVLLPVCSLGRNDWVLRVMLSYNEKVNLTEFKFTQ